MTTTRSLRRLALGGLLVTAALAIPTAANAGDATVSPVPIHPGGTVDIVAQCSVKATSASVSATTLGGASNVPMTASSQQPGDWVVSLIIPGDAAPGSYDLGGTCSDGDGFTAVVVVSTSTGPSGGGGWSMGGPNETLLVTGSSLLAAAVVGGALLMRRPRQSIPARIRRHGRS
ncbi:hypothetical protein F4553_007474 [Allocatelliglobosispora scoriae]|uniref:Uncharacterized protein n=1 Tax=Allocatelliglobosispora scoriae TaxID=643052 RepID=A0A841C509_9ACTN|nr:hypothetical protein [Allocatelliglobosispora scoriae]MBB5874040.1 hypothetical protein [Allocatelliglobosispora scoriae]